MLGEGGVLADKIAAEGIP